MKVEISDTIIEAIERHTAGFEPKPRGIKYNVNLMLYEYLIDYLPYDGYSELHELNLDDVAP